MPDEAAGLTPAALRRALADYTPLDIPALPGRSNHLLAGVLVPLVFQPEPVCLVTLRAAHLSQHAGEVSFPGGKPEPGDGGLEHTALREAREELGIRRAEVLGTLSAMPLYTSDWRLVPYVAAVPPEPLVPSPDEVARVLHLPLIEWLDRDHIEGIPYTQPGGHTAGYSGYSPVFELDGCVMYGGTAHTFLELLQVVAPLLGRAVPPLRESRHTWSELLGE